MRLGIVLPNNEIGSDPGALRAYAQAIEDQGYHHLVAYDHVVGADVRNRRDWRPLFDGPPGYTHEDAFHEPLVLFGFLAGATQRLELMTGVLVLGQRQTTLVAKQAAEVDVLCEGRLRFGVGIGWNDVEYEALGQEFHDRGIRSEEQIALLRALWTEEVVTFEGRWHRVIEAGINPLPRQRPIPLWIGGWADAAVRRAARLADGFFTVAPPDEGESLVAQYRAYAAAAGRDPAQLGLEARIAFGGRGIPGQVSSVTTIDACAALARRWREIGATHLCVEVTLGRPDCVDAHIDTARELFAALAEC